MPELIVRYQKRTSEKDPARVIGECVGELVRCKDCKYWDEQCQQCERIDGIILPDFFCADGEKRT